MKWHETNLCHDLHREMNFGINCGFKGVTYYPPPQSPSVLGAGARQTQFRNIDRSTSFNQYFPLFGRL